MSFDTILNILAVILALAAAIGAALAYHISRNNSIAIATLPPKLAPNQAALNGFTREASAVSGLLKDDADRLREYQDILKDNAQLKVANGNLRASIEAKDGQIVHLTDTLHLVNGLNEKHLAMINKLTNVNAEHARNIEEMRLLIEQLTAAIDVKQ